LDSHVHIHVHCDNNVAVQLATLTESIAAMSAELDRLTQEVAETHEVVNSAIVLLNGLSAQIRHLRLDPKKLDELADSLDAKQAELAAAITANTDTPADPVEEPTE
jgi:chromosome segregation ATPase